jgi:hypothetical protein
MVIEVLESRQQGLDILSWRNCLKQTVELANEDTHECVGVAVVEVVATSPVKSAVESKHATTSTNLSGGKKHFPK